MKGISFFWRAAGEEVEVVYRQSKLIKLLFLVIGAIMGVNFFIILIGTFTTIMNVFNSYLLALFLAPVFSLVIWNLLRFNLITSRVDINEFKSLGKSLGLVFTYVLRVLLVVLISGFIAKTVQIFIWGESGSLLTNIKATNDNLFISVLLFLIVLVMFLSPLVLKLFTNVKGSYFKYLKKHERNIIVNEYKMFKKAYSNTIKRYNKALPYFEEHFQDAPFNLIRKTSIHRSVASQNDVLEELFKIEME